MANCPCICSDLDCSEVLSCVNDDLIVIQVGEQNPTLQNFCSAVISCVDAQFQNIVNGDATDFDYYGASILVILKSISGWSDSGDLVLGAQDGDIQWLSSIAAGQTYMDDGDGIDMTGDGSSGNPFIPNLITGYVRGLLSASNGITYDAGTGLFKWGGSLVENTTITGGGFDITLTGVDVLDSTSVYAAIRTDSGGGQAVLELDAPTDTAKLSFISGGDEFSLELSSVTGTTLMSETTLTLIDGSSSVSEAFFKIAAFSAANNGDVLTLQNKVTGQVYWTTPAASGGTYTDEMAQDSVGGILTDSATIDFTYDDGLNTITAIVINDSITFAKIQNITSDRLLGRDTAASGDTEEITVGGGVEFTGSGGIQTSAFTGDVTKTAGGTALTITNDAVTDAKLRDSSGFSVIGKATTGAGNPADIVAGTDTVLGRVGSADVAFAQVSTGQIANDAVTFAKMQNINTQRVLGRTTAGGGNVEELTPGAHVVLSGGVINTYGRTLIGITKFDVTGTWTKPVGCNAVVVYTTAGGGGGGGANAAASEAAAGGGGGAGATMIHYITAGLGATEAVTVGAAGAAGVVGNAYVGQDGGNSSFGAHTLAEGGGGGATLASGTSVAAANGGLGGLPSAPTGTAQGGGQTGISGIRFSLSTGIGGVGGSSFYGGNGDYTYGAGGNGNFDQDGSAEDGSAGGGGLVLVYEYS